MASNFAAKFDAVFPADRGISPPGGAIRRAASAFTPADTNPVLWYDLQDGSTLTANLSNSFLNYIPIDTIENKANPGVYDLDTNTSNLLYIEADSMNHHVSIGNRGNGEMETHYAPSEDTKSFATVFNMPTTPGTRAPFGCNDAANRRFYVGLYLNRISVGFGSAYQYTITTYTPGEQIVLICIANGSTFDVWINGVKEIGAKAYSFSGTSSDTMLVHARTSGGTPASNFNTGYMGDLIVWEEEISDETRVLIHDYLTNTYADNIVYHVISIAGQSNAAGQTAPADYTGDQAIDFRIHQINRTGSFDGLVIPAVEPLEHASTLSQAVGPGQFAAKRYLEGISDPNVRVLLVPTAQGSTGFSNNYWNVGDAQYLDTISRCNTAMTKGSSAEFKLFIWQQLERDVGHYTEQQYIDLFALMLAGFRANITGAANAFCTVGDPVPDFNAGALAGAPAEIPNQIANTGYVSNAGTDDNGDNLHFDIPSYKIMGRRHVDAYNAAQ